MIAAGIMKKCRITSFYGVFSDKVFVSSEHINTEIKELNHFVYWKNFVQI